MTTGEKLTFGAILLIGALAAMVIPLIRDRQDASACAVRYAQAKTAADSLRIDRQRAPIERGAGGAQTRPATCAELRQQQP